MTATLNPYPAMKDSGVPWLGKVPEHWEVRRLRQILNRVTYRNRPDLPLLSVVREKGVIRRDKTSKDENHNFIPDDLTNYKVVHAGQFAMNKMKAWQGSYGVSAFDGIVSPAYFVFDIRGVHGAFFHTAIRSSTYVPSFTRASDGVRIGQWDLSETRMKEIAFAVPPLPEQAAIVRFLDHADRRIRRYIRAKQKLIKLLEEQKQAIIHRAVTRGLDPNVRLKPSGVEWLGDVPEHWEVKKLRLLFRYAKGRRAAEITNEYIGKHPGLFPVYSGQTESGGIMGQIDWHEFEFSNPVVFVTTVGARAMSTRLVHGRFSLSQNCALIIPRAHAAYTPFFEWVLQRVFDYEKASISLIMQPSLRFSDLNKFYVSVPPPAEQAIIFTKTTERLSSIELVGERCRREIHLLREYRSRLIADVVTGKLDVREAAARLPDEVEEPEPEESAPSDEPEMTEGLDPSEELAGEVSA